MLEISLDGNPGTEVEMESSSRRLRKRYYIGGRKDFGNMGGNVRVVDHPAIDHTLKQRDVQNNGDVLPFSETDEHI